MTESVDTLRRVSPRALQTISSLEKVMDIILSYGFRARVSGAIAMRGGDRDTDDDVSRSVRGRGHLYAENDVRIRAAVASLWNGCEIEDVPIGFIALTRATAAVYMGATWESAIKPVFASVLESLPVPHADVSLLDRRWPQPADYYDIPPGRVQLCEALYSERNTADDSQVAMIDDAIRILMSDHFPMARSSAPRRDTTEVRR